MTISLSHQNLTRFSLNEIQLIGSVSKIDLLNTSKERSVIEFDVVTNERFRNAVNGWDSIAEYHHCLASGKKAEDIALRVAKSTYVWIRGAVKTVKFSSGGQIKNKVQIHVREWSILSKADFRESSNNLMESGVSPLSMGGES